MNFGEKKRKDNQEGQKKEYGPEYVSIVITFFSRDWKAQSMREHVSNTLGGWKGEILKPVKTKSSPTTKAPRTKNNQRKIERKKGANYNKGKMYIWLELFQLTETW